MANRPSTAATTDFYGVKTRPSVRTHEANWLSQLRALSRSQWLTYAALYSVWFLVIFSATSGWSNPAQWYEGWNRWDSDWYARIWSDGYQKDPVSLVFPPGFPYFVGSLSVLLGAKFSAMAFLINVPAFFIAGGLFAQMGERRFGIPGTALFLFFLSAPAAYFAFAPYSDSLFLLLFWIALPIAIKDPATLSLRERLGALALMLVMPWVRLVGYALLSWTVLRRWFATATLLSLWGWFALNAYIGGSPLFFLRSQSKFLMGDGGFLTGLMNSLRQFPPDLADRNFEWVPWTQFYGLPMLYLVLMFGAALWFIAKKEWLLASTIASVTVFSHNQSFWRSAVRYDLVVGALIAIPILSSALNPRRSPWLRRFAIAVFAVLTIGGMLLQIHFSQLFRAGAWGF